MLSQVLHSIWKRGSLPLLSFLLFFFQFLRLILSVPFQAPFYPSMFPSWYNFYYTWKSACPVRLYFYLTARIISLCNLCNHKIIIIGYLKVSSTSRVEIPNYSSQVIFCNMGIYLCGRYIIMTKECLNHPEISPTLQKMRCKTVSE